MSCMPEQIYSVYVDGELAGGDLRQVEAHLVGCERCRRLVVGLREESRLFSDVLLEKGEEQLPVTLEAPARGLLFAMPVTLLIAAVVTGVVGVILETRMPSGTRWLNPSSLFGVNEMIFDLVFAIRDRAPGLVEFSVAVAATASLAALVTFLASVLLRRLSGAVALGLVAAFLAWAPPSEAAVDVRHEDSVRVPEGEVLKSTLVASAEIVRIDGVVDGNVVVFTDRLVIHGKVHGNVLAIAREVEVQGLVTGSLVTGSEQVRVGGEVRGNVLAGCDRFNLEREGTIGGDLAAFGDVFILEGSVDRDVLGHMRRLELRGRVSRDVEVVPGRLTVESSARITGDLRAHVESLDVVSVDSGAVIGGETKTEVIEHHLGSPLSRYSKPGFYLWLLVRLAAAFLVGLALYSLVPAFFSGSIESARECFGCLGLGFAVALLTPLVLVLVALTLVGIPVAMLGICLYAAGVYLAGIRIAALIGASLTTPEAGSLRDFGMALLIGLVVLAVGMNLPFLGILVRIAVVFVGLGLLVREASAAWQGRRAAA